MNNLAESIQRFREQWRSKTDQERKTSVAVYIALAIGLLLLVATICGSAYAGLRPNAEHSSIYYGFTNMIGMTIVLYLIFIVIIFMLMTKISYANKVDRVDERGVRVMKNDDYGGSRYMNEIGRAHV